MSEIQVTTAQLRAKAEELRNLNSKFSTQVEELSSEENSLNSMWEGEAKDAFHTAFNNDKTQMETFHTEVEKYVNALEQIIQKYEDAERKNTSTASTRSY